MKVYDVIIVGAGPAGSALAIELASEGFDVLLMDQAAFPRDKVCGDFVSPKGLRFLADLGCWRDVAACGCIPIRRSSVYLNGRELSEGSLPTLPGHPPFGYAIPRTRLDEILFRRAQRVGVHTLERCRFVNMIHGESFVTVDAERSHADRKGRDRKMRYAARTIVGADGANSAVARATGLAMNDPRYVLLSVRAYCRGLPLDRTVLFFDEAFFPGFGWIFPVSGETCNVGVGMVKEPMKKDGLRLKDFFARLERFVEALAAEHGCRVDIEPTAGWPIKSFGGTASNVFERGLLIGEAGCFVDPISGEGIPLAMETAQMAAATLRGAFGAGDFSAQALGDFERRWRDRYDVDLRVSDLVVSMIRNRYLLELWMLSFRVMCMTALRDEDYALKTGGILAGLVPNREGFSADVVLKSLVHGPAFWMEALNLAADDVPRGLLRKGAQFAEWQARLAGQALGDFDWFRGWVEEIGDKQRHLFRALGEARRQSVSRPLIG